MARSSRIAVAMGAVSSPTAAKSSVLTVLSEASSMSDIPRSRAPTRIAG
jgi:hypothetical protein